MPRNCGRHRQWHHRIAVLPRNKTRPSSVGCTIRTWRPVTGGWAAGICTRRKTLGLSWEDCRHELWQADIHCCLSAWHTAFLGKGDGGSLLGFPVGVGPASRFRTARQGKQTARVRFILARLAARTFGRTSIRPAPASLGRTGSRRTAVLSRRSRTDWDTPSAYLFSFFPSLIGAAANSTQATDTPV